MGVCPATKCRPGGRLSPNLRTRRSTKPLTRNSAVTLLWLCGFNLLLTRAEEIHLENLPTIASTVTIMSPASRIVARNTAALPGVTAPIGGGGRARRARPRAAR